MSMNKNTFLVVLALIVIVIVGVYAYMEQASVAPSTTEEEPSAGRAMSIEQYVTNTISSLSPIKEQLGGTFYVTKIEADGGSGVVEYEDGHNAYVADFTYEIEPEHGAITITSFTVRE